MGELKGGDKEGAGNEYRLEPFFELSPDLLCIAGFDGYFKRVNPAFCELLGYSEDELFSRPINAFVHEEDKESTNIRREKLRNNAPLLNFENRYVRKSGEIVWLSWTSIPVQGDQLIYAIAKDITYNKGMEEERNRLLANFTRINQNLKLLNYSTSHDLRSPVNNLQMVFELLDMSKIQDEEALEIIEVMKEATVSLKDTLNNYVDLLGRNEAIEAELEDINLKKVMVDVCKSIESLIVNTATTFKVDFSAFEEIRFNRAYMQSIFLNLITNSIKYAREGVPAEISVYTRQKNGVSQLVFADNGKGFDMEKVRGKIFGLHQKFNDQRESRGIGLYLVHNHVVSMGGNIRVDSTLGKGTTFTISFRN